MTVNESTNITDNGLGWFARLWIFLTGPHSSIQEIGEKRRAQLLAILTLILMVAYIGALVSKPTSYSDLIALLSVTLIAYGLSRTAYARIGAYFFCFSFTAFGYITLWLGTASNYSSAITTSVHIALVVSSILLSSGSLTMLVVLVAIASITAPQYSHVPIAINTDFYKDTGVVIAL